MRSVKRLTRVHPAGPEAVPDEVRCPECGSAAPYRDVHPAIDAAKKAYVDADMTQYSGTSQFGSSLTSMQGLITRIAVSARSSAVAPTSRRSYLGSDDVTRAEPANRPFRVSVVFGASTPTHPPAARSSI